MDLDCAEAIAAAQTAKFLPATEMIHGRPGSPSSHWWYIADLVPPTCRFQDVDGTSLLELRSGGCQTVVPPSIHPAGEAYEWIVRGEPGRVKCNELQLWCRVLASCVLMARLMKPTEPGSRHSLARI